MIEPLGLSYEIIPPKENIPGVVGFVQNQLFTLPHEAGGFILAYSGVIFTPEYKDFMFETKKWEEHVWYGMNEFGQYIEKNFWHIYREHENKVGKNGGLITEFSHAIFSLGHDKKSDKPLYLYIKNGALVLDSYVKKNFPQHALDVQGLKEGITLQIIGMLFFLLLPFIIAIVMAYGFS